MLSMSDTLGSTPSTTKVQFNSVDFSNKNWLMQER